MNTCNIWRHIKSIPPTLHHIIWRLLSYLCMTHNSHHSHELHMQSLHLSSLTRRIDLSLWNWCPSWHTSHCHSNFPILPCAGLGFIYLLMTCLGLHLDGLAFIMRDRLPFQLWALLSAQWLALSVVSLLAPGATTLPSLKGHCIIPLLLTTWLHIVCVTITCIIYYCYH